MMTRLTLATVLFALCLLGGIAPSTPRLPWSAVALEATYQPSAVKSAQCFAIANANGGTATLSPAVTVATAAVLWTGVGSGSNAPQTSTAKLTLTNTTTVTAASNSSIPVTGCVIDFVPQFIKSIQAVDISIGGGTSDTATITAVNTAKTVIFFRGWLNATASWGGQSQMGRLTLTSATVVTATIPATETTTVHGTVVEFK